MHNKRLSISLIVILLILVSLACSGSQSLFNSSGVKGEAQDAEHTEWSDLFEGDQQNQDRQDPGSDTLEGETRSSDGADSDQSSQPSGEIEVDPSLDQTTLGQQIQSGDLIIDLIKTTGGGTQGKIIEIVMINQSGEEIIFEIPPGLVFSPVGSDEQDLMVLDGEIVTLDPGETIVLSPYVICIESSASTPSSGSAYQIGYLADGDLLAFAECVDRETEGDLGDDDFSLQLAAWSIANQGQILAMPEGIEGLEGAFAEMLEGWEISGLLEIMTETMGAMSEEWIQRCDLSLEGDD